MLGNKGILNRENAIEHLTSVCSKFYKLEIMLIMLCAVVQGVGIYTVGKLLSSWISTTKKFHLPKLRMLGCHDRTTRIFDSEILPELESL